jgi:hypothetical protein
MLGERLPGRIVDDEAVRVLLDDPRQREAASDGRTWSKGATERTIGRLWPPEGH